MNTFKKILLLLFTGSLLFLTLSGSLLAQQNNLDVVLQKAQESGINKSALAQLQQRASNQGISDAQLVELIQPAIDMAGQNLPADFALGKAMEGLSKGIPASRIVPVLQQLNRKTAEAAKIVNPWLEKPEVKNMIVNSTAGMSEEKFSSELTIATAKALNQNISHETARGMFDEMGDESVLGQTSPPDIIAAVGIMPDMPQGVEPSQSGKFVIRALKGGFKANELQNLPSAMSMAQQRSELPAASVVEGVSEQLKGGVPAKQILQNLFNGQIGGGPPGSIPKGLENQSDQGNRGNNGNQGNNGGN
jgi:uncharacterized protein YjgD (DUF1641 family)